MNTMHSHPGCPVSVSTSTSHEASGQRCARFITLDGRTRSTRGLGGLGGRKSLVGLSYCAAVEVSNGFSYREALP